MRPMAPVCVSGDSALLERFPLGWVMGRCQCAIFFVGRVVNNKVWAALELSPGMCVVVSRDYITLGWGSFSGPQFV